MAPAYRGSVDCKPVTARKRVLSRSLASRTRVTDGLEIGEVIDDYLQDSGSSTVSITTLIGIYSKTIALPLHAFILYW